MTHQAGGGVSRAFSAFSYAMKVTEIKFLNLTFLKESSKKSPGLKKSLSISSGSLLVFD